MWSRASRLVLSAAVLNSPSARDELACRWFEPYATRSTAFLPGLARCGEAPAVRLGRARLRAWPQQSDAVGRRDRTERAGRIVPSAVTSVAALCRSAHR